jgi:hypothetical protein
MKFDSIEQFFLLNTKQNLFSNATDEGAKLGKVFVPTKPFQPSIIFEIKGRSVSGTNHYSLMFQNNCDEVNIVS